MTREEFRGIEIAYLEAWRDYDREKAERGKATAKTRRKLEALADLLSEWENK